MAELLRVTVEPSRVALTPGGPEASLQVQVYNATRIVDEFHVAVVGTGQWLDADTARVHLFPDAEETVSLALRIPAGRFVTAGERTIGVKVSSATDTALTSTERVQVTVGAVRAEEALTLEPQIARGAGHLRVLATVTNRGNAPIAVSLAGNDAEKQVAFSFEPSSIQVPAGGQAQAWVTASAKRPFSGADRPRQITVRAEGSGTPMQAACTFVQKPVISRARLLLMAMLFTLAGAGALVASAFLSWTLAPEKKTGLDLTYISYARTAFGMENLTRRTGPLPDAVYDVLTSVGLLAIGLGAVGALGLLGRKGRLTRLAGGASMVGLVGFAAGLTGIFGGSKATIGPGVWVALAGGVFMLAGGMLRGRTAR